MPSRGLVARGNPFAPVVTTYLVSVLMPMHGREYGIQATRELQSLGAIIDLVLDGYVPEALDALMMRFQAMESARSLGL